MDTKVSPVYLFADSQLLFLQEDNTPLLHRPLSNLAAESVGAAYIGVSNDDNPVFFNLFEAAMDQLAVRRYKQITKKFTSTERHFLEQADLIVLAGGDMLSGWQVMQETGMAQIVRSRYHQGALLIGVSAGAVQLGFCGLQQESACREMLQIVPYLIDVHAEDDWSALKNHLADHHPHAVGLGIPQGAGLVWHPDRTVEAIRKPVAEYRVRQGQVFRGLILPASGDNPEANR